MGLNLSKVQELPSVRAAVTWLLGHPSDNANGDALASALASGLIKSEDSPHWKADGDMVARRAESALAQLPHDPEQLGNILHGVGEMAARSHASALPALVANYLTARCGQLQLEKVLDSVVKCDTAIPRQVRPGAIAFAQWLSRARLEWGTFHTAVVRLGHLDDLLGGGRFGLRFAARAILSADPNVIDDWIDAHPDHPAIGTIGSAALSMVFPFDAEAMIAPLLASKNVGIRCLAAASIVCPVGLSPPSSFRDCHRALVAAGFTAANATWMTGMRTKNAVHARYRIENGREQDAARLRYVEQNPDKAMGGLRNAEAEIEMLRGRLDRADEAYSELLPELEAMLSDMATDWPAGGLSNEQMLSLDYIFVDTAEIRHRLAAKLTHKANRDWLLKRNITKWQDFIGLRKDPADIPRKYFLPDERRFDAIAKWTAQSLILLYDTDNRGIGRRTSDLVSGVAAAAEKLIAQPFISGRQSETWQSVLTRSACADRFAFTVVANMPAGRRDAVARLNELALDHAFALLSARNPPSNPVSPLHELTAQAVERIGFSSAPEEYREKWARAEDLPHFARALAIWSSPPLVEKHKQLACDLFQRVSVPPLSHGTYNLQMSRMLTLLDIAIASSAREGKSDLISCIRDLWKSAYRDWLTINTQWDDIAERLASAVTIDGSERAQIVADRVFDNSYCRRLIDQASQRDNAISPLDF
jgi:hypothetical protein